MKSTMLEYSVAQRRPIWSVRAVVGWAVGLGAAVALAMQGCTSIYRVDAITGSSSSRTTGPLGIPMGTRVEVSPLERRLRQMGVTWVADWRCLSDVHYSLFDWSRGCGSAPAIYFLRSGMKEFVDGSSDQEVREFVRVMQTGTDAEQRAAVEAAEEKGLRAMGVN